MTKTVNAQVLKEVIKTADTNIQSLSKVIDTTKLEEQFASSSCSILDAGPVLRGLISWVVQ